MISSDMPVFIARVALCSTWLAGANRRRKKSWMLGLSGIGSIFFTFCPRLPVNTEPAPRRTGRVSICASISATVGNFSGWPWAPPFWATSSSSLSSM